jgi:hypothetical protein
MPRWATPLLAALLVASSALAWFFYSRCDGDGRESPGDKSEWSILEMLEARGRGRPISGLEFSQEGEYRILALPAITGERIWIMLNPQNPPYYKQIPHTDYTLTEDQYSQILRTHRPISTVDECLSSHVQRAR